MTKLTILYDNFARGGLQSAWGFSCFIEAREKNVLFDTGWDGNLLLSNMEKLDISPQDVDILVLSHQHWDHIGGVATFLNVNPDVEVYVPSSFSPRLKQEISNLLLPKSDSVNPGSLSCLYSENPHFHEVIDSEKICDGVHSTGEIGNQIKEQSLIIESGRSSCIVCGCAHPGIAPVMDKASAFGTPFSIFGGLHDSSDYDLFKDFELIGAGHCTSHKEEIRQLYPESFIDIAAGYTIEI